MLKFIKILFKNKKMSQNFEENFKINDYTNFARITFSREIFS
jgi:hypothetical protein